MWKCVIFHSELTLEQSSNPERSLKRLCYSSTSLIVRHSLLTVNRSTFSPNSEPFCRRVNDDSIIISTNSNCQLAAWPLPSNWGTELNFIKQQRIRSRIRELCFIEIAQTGSTAKHHWACEWAQWRFFVGSLHWEFSLGVFTRIKTNRLTDS